MDIMSSDSSRSQAGAEEGEVSGAEGESSSPKRPYVAPALSRLGTIRELTRGAGKNRLADGVHPPGNNKSIL